MVISEPIWSFTAKKTVYQWYGHAYLLENHVVGQWFTLKRETGQCLWEHDFGRPNTIFGFSDEVILASEMRSDGPWTADFGCYGISLASGKQLWRWYGKGWWGRFLELLDHIPGFTNDLRASLVGIKGKECITDNGHVLEIKSGKWLRKEADTANWEAKPYPQTNAEKIYDNRQIQIESGKWVSTRNGKMRMPRKFVMSDEHFGFRLIADNGALLWDWGVEKIGLNPLVNYFGWRLMGTEILMLAGEEPDCVPIKRSEPLFVKPNPTKYHLVVLDALTGNVLQRLPVSLEKVTDCRIEDVDEKGFLLSYDNKQLNYFAFASAKTN
jgi:hypothetical protein